MNAKAGDSCALNGNPMTQHSLGLGFGSERGLLLQASKSNGSQLPPSRRSPGIEHSESLAELLKKLNFPSPNTPNSMPKAFCGCAHLDTRMHLHLHTNMHTHIQTPMHTDTYACAYHAYAYAYVHIPIHTRRYVYSCITIYTHVFPQIQSTYICICIYIYIYIHIYIYTHVEAIYIL